MSIETNVKDGILVVRLRGDLDHHAVESIRDQIEAALEETHYRGLVLSFRGIEFMDSSGLGLILGRYRTLSQRGGRMAICEITAPLRRIFEMSGLLKILPVYDREDGAIRAVKEG
ncbi:anti-sigma F factor antagonist [Alicyclobacillus macrosporangiidus]|jgi:stage II sporulation protein AA (anti-sigma F factor antagonist)|uniref:Anti-sigma F factor antagonist n=1 Tax=Alicyclobacillus macrosporangiidus TaxID=392015 RepID=A0A1I7KMM3_9BACL|nr:anti-sigma F factor antagonist [Alicyclobacillus macrosporangiidus]SFU98604.1 stage II sporulation protein AA (anti-sigma F factor antagonist) [Alicyclobacillus macrosporangiidus]